ncbi:protein DpdJ [Kitasatospora cineracea]|uniref:Helicase-like protein n=1 Tax=Kitasatospora cineracea TaxID=88074 RepID=A0A3N4REU1_9ACTN|nr:protein DpdJ [Kitasatospora cineracea]RPE31822.1 helicase-like protein [Kitasatospora cineracea]
MVDAIEAEILELLESREDPLLSWGVVDGGFTYAELCNHVGNVLSAHQDPTSPEDVIDELRQKGMLYEDHSIGQPRWRTRNGEGLRLLARMRQIFPNGGQNPQDAWRQGTSLVADFRYARRARAYPKRDRARQEAVDGLEGASEVYRRVVDAMTLRGSKHAELSGFQVRATRQVLTALREKISTATVVGAGTGSGKTMAFYLPAFAHLAALRDASSWTRALAVYPRNELLKDQLNTAFVTACRLDQLWRETNKRPMTIGVLNKDTPNKSANILDKRSYYASWTRGPRGFRCPQFTCPGDGYSPCGGDLFWSEKDIRADVELLTCGTCNRGFDNTVLVLTRKRMGTRPPDLLFTTTEGLNRGLSNLALRKLFGIDVAKKPRLMLLDEIHTYSGTTGAQAAMVLRRWHHALQSPVTFVGLSATLSNPVRHMADLTGVEDGLVTNIEPAPEEMEYEGAEYLVALRSDPTSGASVLSTTIQTAMLLPRILDSPSSRLSKGLLGTKAFVFTDDLDVTNRLFFYLLDAEGQRYRNRKREQFKEPLAALRAPGQHNPSDKRRAGQSWDLPLDLGHPLNHKGLTVSRTTSQDSGVDAESQLVVATASLEVGFDDPAVGAVLQHKAPRGVAPFLQRKGRAGRNRGMRPYTVVVLSDYGRDRAAYEAWDTLFDPVLPELVLPIRNRAVLRMQATLAMLDWLAEQLRPKHPYAHMWRDLKGLTDPKYPDNRKVQQTAADVLELLLHDQALQRSLRLWVEGALQISEKLAAEILWHPPRPVVLAAVPALLRRLRSEWAVASSDMLITGKDVMGGTPLPDFFPENLFSELALPEGQVTVPSQSNKPQEREKNAMGMAQMLREFAPGRVSRRFATHILEHRHWIPIPFDQRETVVALDSVLELHHREEVATVEIEGTPTAIPVVRPDQVALSLAPGDLKDSSNAVMVWRSEFLERGRGLVARIPSSDLIGRILPEARFFLHAQNSHVEVRRVAIESEANLLFSPNNEARVTTRFSLDGEQIGLGAVYDVDGLRLKVNLPQEFSPPEEVDASLRSAWFQYLMTSDEALLEQANKFQLEWLHQTVECMLLMSAVTSGTSLPEAYQKVRNSFAARLSETLHAMFRSPDVEDTGNTTITRVGGRLNALLSDQKVINRLDHLTEQVWNPDPERFHSWLRQRVLATLGQAALWAARDICPEHDPDGIIVDVEPGYSPDGNPRRDEVWLTESSVGGGGFIEALASRVRPDPRRFLRLVSRALQPSSTELLDAHLRRIVRYITTNSDWSDLVSDYRGSATQEKRVANLNRIRAQLRTSGIQGAEQTVVSGLANRLLRPGSNSQTDQALRTIVDEWEAAEKRLGLEISPRTWAYLMRDRQDLAPGLSLAAGAGERQRIDAVQSLLWPRGWAVRANALQSWNPYADNLPAAADLVRGLFTATAETIDVTLPGADGLVRTRLADHGSAQLAARPEDAAALANMLVDLSVHAVETDFLQVHPRIVEIDHRPDGSIVASLELAEVAA